jgi:ribosomal protein L37AE/L43A
VKGDSFENYIKYPKILKICNKCHQAQVQVTDEDIWGCFCGEYPSITLKKGRKDE